ncbi:MAG: matrixin family metalloprotease [bacterium]|nr:matrixin family metalloprotease [bacterium]
MNRFRLQTILAVLIAMVLPGLSLANSDAQTTSPSPVESSLWANVTSYEAKRIATSGIAYQAFCFDPGTSEEDVINLLNHVYPDWNNPALYISSSRWTSTATGTTGVQGEPTVLTYSFVPDGVAVPDGGFGAQTNNINAMMTSKFGSVANGKAKFRQLFNQWQALSGITYIEETNDDGAALHTSPGVLGVRGDIRISATPMDGNSGVLAYNYFPNTGDMVLDNAESWQASANDYRFFRNVCTHEAGHGIGLSHVCPDDCQFLMEPFICTLYDGPQHDDIRGAQRQYGDSAETNDTPATATPFGNVPDGTTTLNNMSIDDNTDQDYFAFTVPVNRQITITMTPVGMFFDQCAQTGPCTCAASDTQRTSDDANLSVRLYGTNGTTVLAEASGNAAGVAGTIANTGLPGAGTYYIRVYQQAALNAIQLYNLSFTVSATIVPVVTLTQPNGGQTWSVGSNQTITWTSANVTGNVNIELNRTYPGGAWESLFANTANDGTQAWTVTGVATSSTCRVRVTSINSPAATDESDANFTIILPTITVVTPNGGEVLNGGLSQSITWNSTGVTGNVNVELNRNYPAGSWTLLATVPNAGANLVFGPPATTTARIRLTSVNEPVATDISDANFTIAIINLSPVIAHDEHADVEPGSTTFTARVTDDGGPITTTLLYRVSGGGAFTSLGMPATGNPSEYAASFVTVEGAYDYFVRATDGTNTVQTDTFTFDVEDCPAAIVFDDGTAEGYNWANEIPFSWAVKYTPPAYPFLLCGFQVAIAKFHPDSTHSPITGRVILADGSAGLPGTVVFSEASGSVGNVIGGLPNGQVAWATVTTLDALGAPLVLGQPFYIAVDNPVLDKYEAFGRDDNTASLNSFFYDGCDSVWYAETDLVPNAQGGQRMIRLLGASIPAPTELVIFPSGNDVILYWASTGAPYYRIYSAITTGGPFTVLEGSTSTLSFTDIGAVTGNDIKFYVVVSSATP